MSQAAEGAEVGLVTRATAGFLDLLIMMTVFLVTDATLNTAVSSLLLFRPRYFGLLATLFPRGGAFLLDAAYLVSSWTLFGQTVGMRLLGIRVTRPDNRGLALPRSVARLLLLNLSLLPFGLGFLWVLVDPQRRAWHDILSGTVVRHSAPARHDVRMRLLR
jgi:uncharacterized RDD family membrane protein YckC